MTAPFLLPVRKVTVYPSMARVVREGTIPIDDMGSKVEVGQLPLALLENSLQVLVGDAAFEVAESTLDWHLELPPEGHKTVLEAELEKIQAEVMALNDKANRIKERIDYWQSLEPALFDAKRLPFSGEDGRIDLLASLEPSERTIRCVSEWMARDQADLREVDEALRQAKERLEAAGDAVRRASTSRSTGPVWRKLVLRLTPRQEQHPGARRAGRRTVKVTLAYLVPGATWCPAYEVRFLEETGEAELAVRAVVAQRTGEDWHRAALALSTADGTWTTALPRLPSLRIGRAQRSMPRTGWRPPPEGLESLFAGYDLENPDRSGTGTPSVSADAGAARETAGFALGQAVEETWPDAEPVDEIFGGMAEEVADETGVEGPPAAPETPEGPPPMALAAPPVTAAGVVPAGRLRQAEGRRLVQEAARRKARGHAIMVDGGDDGPLAITAGPPPGAALPPALEVDDEWLRYDSLRLAGPDEPGRGKLRTRPLLEVLGESAGTARIAPRIASLVAQQDRAARAVAGLPLPPLARPVTETRGRFDYLYRSECEIDLPSDGRFHTLTLMRGRAAARVAYRTVPAVEPAIYRELILDNPIDAPLLAGPADLYVGNDLVSTSSLETVAEGGAIRLGLGVEDRIEVARNVHYVESAASLLGKQSLQHDVELAFTSQLDEPVTIDVIERVPVTDSPDLEIEEHYRDMEPVEYDQVDRGRPIRGGRLFRVRVEPRGTTKVSYRYRVIMPAKYELVGGNRRD